MVPGGALDVVFFVVFFPSFLPSLRKLSSANLTRRLDASEPSRPWNSRAQQRFAIPAWVIYGGCVCIDERSPADASSFGHNEGRDYYS